MEATEGLFFKADGVAYKAVEYGKKNCAKCEARKACEGGNEFIQSTCKTNHIARVRKLRKTECVCNKPVEKDA